MPGDDVVKDCAFERDAHDGQDLAVARYGDEYHREVQGRHEAHEKGYHLQPERKVECNKRKVKCKE